ncbi:MAG: hypothetical protein HYU36_00965 [Planctomycetes bacterium]|nr:hypothetical protein [Planctomycetota bacterium]
MIFGAGGEFRNRSLRISTDDRAGPSVSNRELVHQLMAKSPADRPTSARQVVERVQ